MQTNRMPVLRFDHVNDEVNPHSLAENVSIKWDSLRYRVVGQNVEVGFVMGHILGILGVNAFEKGYRIKEEEICNKKMQHIW